MQVTVEETTALERKMQVSIPFEDIEGKIKKRLQEVMKTVRIDGFRPGKVPEHIIKMQFGSNIESEAVSETVRQCLMDALTQKDLTPAASPSLAFEHPYQAGQPFVFTATFEIFPEITLLPYSDLVIEKITTEISAEDIEKTLEGMQKQRTEWQEINRPAQAGDKVWISFEGKIDDKPFEGGKAENMPLILGSHTMIPGFEEGLHNATAGQTLVLNVDFPENYHVKTLAGKPAQFHTQVNKIEEPLLPELNDSFATHYGITEGGIEKLRDHVKETLTKQLSTTLHNKLKSEVMSKLAKAYKDLAVPTALIQREAAHLKDQMQQQFAQFKHATAPELQVDMFMDKAKERVILGLVVNKIVENKHLKPEPAKVRQLIETIAERFDQPQKIIEFYYHDKKRLSEIEALAIEEQVVDNILLEAVIVEKPGKVSEILSTEGNH